MKKFHNAMMRLKEKRMAIRKNIDILLLKKETNKVTRRLEYWKSEYLKVLKRHDNIVWESIKAKI